MKTHHDDNHAPHSDLSSVSVSVDSSLTHSAQTMSQLQLPRLAHAQVRIWSKMPFLEQFLCQIAKDENRASRASRPYSAQKSPVSWDNANFHDRSHLALYGNIKIPRAYCHTCQSFAFILDDKFQCCETPFVAHPTKVKRISEPEPRRKKPSKSHQKKLLEQFDYRCAYCDRAFGSSVVIHSKLRLLTVAWDHNVPFAYSQNNRDTNFLPACQVCNGWKSSKIFRTIDDVRIFVQTKWQALFLIVVLLLSTSPAHASPTLWKVTAYCACMKCCGKSDGITASGRTAQAHRTVALNWLPFGTQVKLNGRVYVVEDRGAKSIFGTKAHPKYALDIYMPTHQEAREFGVQYLAVEVLS